MTDLKGKSFYDKTADFSEDEYTSVVILIVWSTSLE